MTWSPPGLAHQVLPLWVHPAGDSLQAVPLHLWLWQRCLNFKLPACWFGIKDDESSVLQRCWWGGKQSCLSLPWLLVQQVKLLRAPCKQAALQGPYLRLKRMDRSLAIKSPHFLLWAPGCTRGSDLTVLSIICHKHLRQAYRLTKLLCFRLYELINSITGIKKLLRQRNVLCEEKKNIPHTKPKKAQA